MRHSLIILSVFVLGCATVGQVRSDTLKASYGTCPEECPGQCIEMQDYCLVVKNDGKPARMNAEGAEVEVPSADLQRLVGCCVELEDKPGEYHKSIRWPLVTEGVPAECIQLATPSKFPNVTMPGVELGHSLQLNQICCGANEGPVTSGDWGACPRCSFECNPAGLAIPDPDGCENFCEGTK